MTLKIPDNLDWDKVDGLLPAIMQDCDTGRVLMLGYMSRDSLAETVRHGRAVFHSRTRNKRWMKGESSGHYLDVVAIAADCDHDALLIRARPTGPVCHIGTATCFVDDRRGGLPFVGELERLIAGRATASPDDSYTAALLAGGTAKIAQKVGEEGVETALAAVTADGDALVGEAADLLYHLLVLLRDRNLTLRHVADELRRRHDADHHLV